MPNTFECLPGYTSHVTSNCIADSKSYLKYKYFDTNIDIVRFYFISDIFDTWGGGTLQNNPSVCFYDFWTELFNTNYSFIL